MFFLLAGSNPPWGRRLKRAGAPIRLALPAAPPAERNNKNLANLDEEDEKKVHICKEGKYWYILYADENVFFTKKHWMY